MEYQRTYYDENGFATEEKSKTTLAKTLQDEEGNMRYFIKFYNEVLLDPLNNNIVSRRILQESEFKRVSPLCFQLYMRFLKNKSISALNQAQRHIQG